MSALDDLEWMANNPPVASFVHHPECWLAAHGVMENGDPMPPCEGGLIRAHLIDQQELRRRGLALAAGDAGTFVLACGGISGLGGHHGAFDVSKKLRVAFAELPDETVVFAIEHDLMPWLERTYNGRPR